jgi:hypothetical protein
MQAEATVEQIYANPDITDKEATSEVVRAQRDELIEKQKSLAPFAEGVLQSQVAEALADFDLTSGGQTVPPVLYHTSSTPLALIVAPRDHIEQIANISVLPTLTLDEQIALENKVSGTLDVSTLVVPIGGVGVYPTMVMETTNLSWVLDTIAHEWAHNYLTLRPLGIRSGHTFCMNIIQSCSALLLTCTPRHLRSGQVCARCKCRLRSGSAGTWSRLIRLSCPPIKWTILRRSTSVLKCTRPA